MTNSNSKPVELSIVSTIYNDGQVIPRLVDELVKQASSISDSFEIILVNDNSLDDTEDRIEKVCKQFSFVKGISLARNYGQQIAISAGVRHCCGEFVILIDGDLENPIEAIPLLYKKIKEGYDIVYAVAKQRQNHLNRFTSQAFWMVISGFLKINIVKNQLMLRIMSKRMVTHYNLYNEISRSVAGITNDIGLKWTILEVTPGKRIAGKSNYTFFKRLNIFIDIVLNLSLKPLNFVIFLGFFTFIFSTLLSIYYVYSYFFVGTIPGYTSIIVSVFFFGSIITFTLGVMARYLSLIYLEVRNRPIFLIKEKYNL
jgi:glycosyltransferase involved in cell wall biosynthesis